MTTSPRQHIEEAGVIAVLRGVDPDAIVDVVEAIVDGGVTVVEVTAESPDAREAIATIDATFDDVLVGAGTVLDPAAVSQLVSAGASFIVSPVTDPDVIDVCHRADVLVAPGAYTPTEVYGAHEAGADLVKVFPAASGGPAHVRAIRGPLGDIPLLPTGGINADNAGAFIDAGAVAVGVGGAIVDHQAIEEGSFETIEANARAVADAVDATRQ